MTEQEKPFKRSTGEWGKKKKKLDLKGKRRNTMKIATEEEYKMPLCPLCEKTCFGCDGFGGIE